MAFNIEEAIKKWKKDLRKYPSLEDGYIDELENHLRDEIEGKTGAGKSMQKVFEEAIKEIGNIEKISEEYFQTDSKGSTKRPPWKENPFLPSLIYNFFKIGVRQMSRNIGYTVINVTGLAIGLACVIVLLSFIKYELTYDSFNENKDNLYRVYLESERNGQMLNFAPVMLPFAPAAEADIPEIKSAIRVSYANRLMRSGDKAFYESVMFVDEEIFNVFSFKLIQGDPAQVLKGPNQIVLSQSASEKYFGEENAVGKTLVVNNKDNFIITGVYEDIPHNSHFRPDMMASIATLYHEKLEKLQEWNHLGNDYAYVLIDKKADLKEVENKFASVLEKNIPAEDASKYTMKLQPIFDVHLSDLTYDNAKTVPFAYLLVFGIIALFILLVACINFINLSTARASRRNREVGVRKSLGALKGQLIFQFLSESVLYVLFAFLLSLAIVYLIIPEANSLFRSNMSFGGIFDREGVILFATILIVTALLSGSYPAFILSRFKPTSIFRNLTNTGARNSRFREVLVIAQFTISVILILGSITVYNQINYMVEGELGFDSEQIAVIPIYDKELRKSTEGFRNSLAGLPGVESVTFSTGTPASGSTQTSNVFPENREDDIHMQILEVDENFINAYGIELLEGRNFNKDFSTDLTDAYIINETALNKIGWTNAVGKMLKIGDGEPTKVIGVIKDFNYTSLRYNIEPMLLKYNNNNSYFCSVKIMKGNKEEVYRNLEGVFLEYSKGYPFEGYLMDKQYMRFYRNENRIATLVSAFALLAILISCLGVFGLVSYVVEQKKKEIAVRKVLGAPVKVIMGLLAKHFVKWVVIANLVAWPLAYYGLNNWLNDFAYRTSLGISVFLMAALVSVMLALLTVSFHVLKASISNPINSLRHE